MTQKQDPKMRRNAILAVLVVLLALAGVVRAAEENWQRKDVDWRAGNGRRIVGIRYPKDSPAATAAKERSIRTKSASTRSLKQATSDTIAVESPPVAGFVPHIAVAVTDEWAGDDLDWAAAVEGAVAGEYLTDAPEYNYIIGLFDTGASTHIVSYEGALRTGIFDADLITPAYVELAGATSSAFGLVSYPLALFMDGLAAIDPDTLTLDDSRMVGQSNISIVVGDEPMADQPDLPTVIGSPMSAYYVTALDNEHPITLMHEDTEYTGPNIEFFQHGDSDIPQYGNRIPMNLIPAGGYNVQYIIDYDGIFNLEFRPGTPSMIVGNSYQSLFFINSVDLYHESRTSLDKDRFMFDTGAQITVISTGIASRLGLDPDEPDFEVDVQDVTGDVTYYPGFFVDTLEIAALGDWLSFTNVPVVMLDVASPEGGNLEGIIGMNLFTEFNLVLHGGGLLGYDAPYLEFERFEPPIVGDIAPEGADGTVDYLDLAALSSAWLSTSESSNWNARADIAPAQLPDGVVSGADFALLASHWKETKTAETEDESGQ